MEQFPYFDTSGPFLIFAIIGIVIFVIIVIVIILIIKAIISSIMDSKSKESNNSYETKNPSDVLNPYRIESQKMKPKEKKIDKSKKDYKFCQYCGAKILKDAKFCSECGTKLN